ncbi:hypothetical protein GpartN1_g6532.t1 [Galdieria partita]|uniref:HSF-type DNA-binding domain-containing protein n=1 Tax=Galdieria partita TaxID=83374 RepID=A0A9C7UT56_9RHOD|nr:hypothetical protein GpartN1_g6532.t1 [Galdieria partita]
MSWNVGVSQTEASCWNPCASDSASEKHGEQVITPFVSKLYDLLAESSNSSFIEWRNSGDCFEVKRPTEFAHQVLPNYYKHNNFSSFVRQLNQYGFRKMDKEKWLFQHPCFKKGRRDLLSRMGRRKSNQRQKFSNLEENTLRTIASGSEEDVKSRTTADILGYWESPTKSCTEYIDRPPTRSGKDKWEWLYRELVSSKERQQKLSYILQLDEQKLESLEKQLWWMKKWISDYVEQYSYSTNFDSHVDTNNNTTALPSEASSSLSCNGKAYLLDQRMPLLDTHVDNAYSSVLGELLDKEWSLLQKKKPLSIEENAFRSDCCYMEQEKGHDILSSRNSNDYPLSISCHASKTSKPVGAVELEPLSEQESTERTECFSKWQLDGSEYVNMSSLSGSVGHSECSHSF